MKICDHCGGAKFEPGEITGRSCKVCYCEHEFSQRSPSGPLTEDDVRRIVREEIRRLLDERSPL